MKTLLLIFAIACTMDGQGTSRFETSETRGGKIRTVQDKLTDTVSVKDYGAKGDGVTDDTAAIQAALNAAAGGSFIVSTTTGSGVSPIVITTTVAHTFVSGSAVTVAAVGGNTNANGRWSGVPLSGTTIALYSLATGAASKGNAAYTSGGTIKAQAIPGLYFPAGTYNISQSVTTQAPMFITGDGPLASIIFMTVQINDNNHHGIISPYSLTIQNLAINTTLLTTNKAMVAVFRSDGTGVGSSQVVGLGETFSFFRFNSSGWNFGVDVGGGPGYNDFLGSVTVRECNISVGTQAGGVAEPVNVRAAFQMTVLDSILTGDTNNDHGIYAIAVLTVLIQNNIISNHGDSSIKLLTDGFHASGCGLSAPVYPSWQILNNTITNGRFAIALYSYCQFEIQNAIIAHNIITELPETYTPNFATVYIQASCQSVMDQVTSTGNLYKDLGLGAIILLSTIQGDTTCLATTAKGTILHFASIGDTFMNWSMSVSTVFPAINTNGGGGTGLKQATISHLYADGGANGTQALNLNDFQSVSILDVTEVNTTVPANAAPKMMLQQTDPAIPMVHLKMAPAATANPFQIVDSANNQVCVVTPAGTVNCPTTPGVYFTNGTFQAAAHIVHGHFLLGVGGTTVVTLTGAAVYTSSTSWDCGGADISAVPHVFGFAISSGSVITLQGFPGDTISIVCTGN